MKKEIILIVLIIFGLFSCEEEVDTNELLNTEEKIFINGYLSPSNEFIEISVTKTIPLFGTDFIYDINDSTDGKEYFLIKDAEVVISDENNNRILLSYSEEKSVYQFPTNEFPIIQGKKYFLNVTVNNNEYTSSCSIPLKKVEDISTILIGGENGVDPYILNVKFKDFLEEKNFYIIGAQIDRNTVDFFSEAFVTDTATDGATISIDGNTSIYSRINNSIITIHIAHVEEIMLEFLRTRYINAYLNDADGDPFATYAIPPTNIEGENGIGVFAGYQLTEKTIEIEIN